MTKDVFTLKLKLADHVRYKAKNQIFANIFFSNSKMVKWVYVFKESGKLMATSKGMCGKP